MLKSSLEISSTVEWSWCCLHEDIRRPQHCVGLMYEENGWLKIHQVLREIYACGIFIRYEGEISRLHRVCTMMLFMGEKPQIILLKEILGDFLDLLDRGGCKSIEEFLDLLKKDKT